MMMEIERYDREQWGSSDKVEKALVALLGLKSQDEINFVPGQVEPGVPHAWWGVRVPRVNGKVLAKLIRLGRKWGLDLAVAPAEGRTLEISLETPFVDNRDPD